MRTIILSPHCDDAPLSLGAALLAGALGTQPEVHLIFGRSRHIKGQGCEGSAESVTATRQAEERRAAQRAGYTAIFWDLAEPFVRPGFEQFRDIFDPRRVPSADPVWDDVMAIIDRAVPSDVDAICVPLGCGNHIDHRIVRDAALNSCASRGLLERLVLYEDLPYAGRRPLDDVDQAVSAISLPLQPVAAGSDRLDDKLALLECYPSQLDASDRQAVAGHFGRVGGERLWTHAASRAIGRQEPSHAISRRTRA
jgi:LmbE family N-acetylglucosaminyl deacetylase